MPLKLFDFAQYQIRVEKSYRRLKEHRKHCGDTVNSTSFSDYSNSEWHVPNNAS